MKKNHNIEKSFLLMRLKQNNNKFLEHLNERNMVDVFYDKCCNSFSDQLKEYLKLDVISKNISDGAYLNQVEELKIKFLSQAIRKLKPFFYTI